MTWAGHQGGRIYRGGRKGECENELVRSIGVIHHRGHRAAQGESLVREYVKKTMKLWAV